MKTHRETLEHELNIVLDANAINKKIRESVAEKLKKHGITHGTVNDLFSRRELIPLSTVSQPLLCLLTVALYESEAEEKYRIDPQKFFTDYEIEEAKSFVVPKEDVTKYPVIFSNVLKFEDDYYVTKITLAEIASLFKKMVIRYNPETQRPLISKAYGDKIVQEIDINKRSIQEIKQNILEGKQITDFIAFNVLQGNTPADIEYDEKNLQLFINSGDINLIDGFHRCLAGLYAYQENPNIDFSYGLVITNWDIDKALRFIHQSDLKNKLKPSFKKAINPNKLSNSIVKKINENSQSYLSGKITTDKHLISPNNKLIMFDVLSDVIDIEFQPKENIDVVKQGKFIMDGLNYIIEQKPELLNETNEILWMTYIVLLKDVYEVDNWQNVLSEKLSKIERNRLESITYKSITKSTIKKIREIISNI